MRWHASRLQFAELEFIHTGEARVPANELECSFRTLIDTVLNKLRRENVLFQTLDDAWNAINDLDAEEQELARAAALLGVDPFDVDDSLADTIVEFWQGTLPSLREDALAGADADSLLKVERWLQRGLSFLGEQQIDGRSDWDRFRGLVSLSGSAAPWRQGYDLARSLLREIGDNESLDPLESSGLSEIPHCKMHAPSTRLQGLVAANSPACAITSRGGRGAFSARPRARGLSGVFARCPRTSQFTGDGLPGPYESVCRGTSCPGPATARTARQRPRQGVRSECAGSGTSRLEFCDPAPDREPSASAIGSSVGYISILPAPSGSGPPTQQSSGAPCFGRCRTSSDLLLRDVEVFAPGLLAVPHVR